MHDIEQENHFHQKYNQKAFQRTLNRFDQLIVLINEIDMNTFLNMFFLF